jgi:hypothetical protein
MDDVSDGFEALPGGTYICEIVGGEPRQAGESAKNPDAWYGALEFDVLSPEEAKGRKLFTNVNLLDNSLFTLAQLCHSTGVTADEVSDAIGDDFEDDERGAAWGDGAKAFLEELIERVTGAKVKVLNRPKKYEGEMRNNVRRISPLSEEDAENMSLLPD